MKILRRLVDCIASMRLSVALFIFLLIITYLGTTYQIEFGLHAAIEKYFISWIIVQEIGGVPLLILPGGYFLMSLLTINLITGGLIRLRWSKRTIGIAITHLGILWMMLAALVNAEFGVEGAVRLDEGATVHAFHDYHDWEIAIAEPVGDDQWREWIIHQDAFTDLTDENERRFDHPELPFTLRLAGYVPNCEPRPKPPMFDVEQTVVDGWFLQGFEVDPQSERNIAGIQAYAETADGKLSAALLWGVGQPPWNQRAWTVDAGERQFAVILRHIRYDLPFSITLNDFHHEFFPGTRKAKEYRSDVTVVDGSSSDDIRIAMNEPLRRGPHVAYQSSYGPPGAGPGEALYSVLAVVRNPSDQWPLYACIVIGIGMTIHFSMMLGRYIRAEMGRRS